MFERDVSRAHDERGGRKNAGKGKSLRRVRGKRKEQANRCPEKNGKL